MPHKSKNPVGGILNALATALHGSIRTAPSIHRLRLGLLGYLIPFAPLAFVSQCQCRPNRVLSPLVFFPISTHFTAPPEIPSAPTVLQLGSFHRLQPCQLIVKEQNRGALLPWKIIQLPHGELAAPTNDINTTVALALLTSVAYFYAGLTKKGLGYFGKYIQPTLILLPINILEDFTKPLSLSFRLFGNILADELVVVVLVSLVPSVVPIPVMFLRLFTSGIQALIFATLAAAYIGESMEGHH
ncbi:hypothetical protein E3N88_37739 [Mikania micrantha]|uniref:ATP synthase subunit a, chloroplastic n=1 Tax=Mikania micrantha TaxID=192012 RepID=A0A5N6LUA3_9ASTR|nr:hypothetical protein E3N88_37739 [Mikania micrantha]